MQEHGCTLSTALNLMVWQHWPSTCVTVDCCPSHASRCYAIVFWVLTTVGVCCMVITSCCSNGVISVLSECNAPPTLFTLPYATDCESPVKPKPPLGLSVGLSSGWCCLPKMLCSGIALSSRLFICLRHPYLLQVFWWVHGWADDLTWDLENIHHSLPVVAKGNIQ